MWDSHPIGLSFNSVTYPHALKPDAETLETDNKDSKNGIPIQAEDNRGADESCNITHSRAL